MNELIITSAKYYQNPMTGQNEIVKVVINGVTMDVPMEIGNTDYSEILRQVEIGQLTIADAD
jgi:hypothetical protein